MLPASRIDAVITLTAEIARTLKENGPAADVLVRRFFQERRYAGSKDRRMVTGTVYDIIRRWGFLYDIADGEPRKMVIAHLHLKGTNLAPLFTSDDYGPGELTDDEKTFIETIQPEKEKHHLLNYPKWLEDDLKSRFKYKFEDALSALNSRAPLTLRVIKDKEHVEEVLKGKGVVYTTGNHINSAIIIHEQIQIRDWPIYRKGYVEIQDEAAQLATKYVQLAPGQQVLDLCAGAGGKTLAAATYMKNKGQIYAFDVAENRLKELKTRAKRSKVHIVQTRTLTNKNRKDTLSEFESKMDRVIIDAPCSGTGTWRRNPEAKWRLTPEILDGYINLQQELMEEGWSLTKQGGRMIYMTCSILEKENEEQAKTFLNKHDDAELVFIRKKNTSKLDGSLFLTPHLDQTDGFYVVIFEKKAIPNP